MEMLYRVTFTRQGKKWEVILEADSKTDAIDQVKEISFGENWEAVLIAIDGEPVNGLKGGEIQDK